MKTDASHGNDTKCGLEPGQLLHSAIFTQSKKPSLIELATMVSGRFVLILTALLSALQPSRVLACPTCAQCSNSYAPPQGYRIYYSTCESGYRFEIAKADIINSDQSDLSIELVRADGSTYVRKVDLCFSLEDVAGQQFTSQVKLICNNLFSNCDYSVDVKGSCTRITSASSSVLIGLSLALAGSIAMALTALM